MDQDRRAVEVLVVLVIISWLSCFALSHGVRYRRLPGDNRTALRDLGPPRSHIKTASSTTLCKSASIPLNCNMFSWYPYTNCNPYLGSRSIGMSSSCKTNSWYAALYQGGWLPIFNGLLVGIQVVCNIQNLTCTLCPYSISVLVP